MLELDLQRVGLKKNEAKVYLALQQLGRARAAEIIENTGLHRNLVYQSLASLVEQQLISKLVTDNVAEFQALDPSELLHAIERQQEVVKRVVSELKDQQTRSRQDIFAYEGNAGFRTAFWDMIETLGPSEELLVMGIFDIDEEFQGMIKTFHEERAEKGIPCKILLNAHAKPVGAMLDAIDRTDVRYLPQGVVTPAVFFVYKGKVLISLPNQRTFFRIENEEASQAFGAYFYTQWNQRTQTFLGEAGARAFMEDTLEAKDIYFIGGNAGLDRFHPEVWSWYKHERLKRNIQWHDLIDRGHKLTGATDPDGFYDEPGIEAKTLPRQVESPHVICIYGTKVANIVWGENTVITVIDDLEVAESHKKYFQYLWDQDTQTFVGEEGVRQFVDLLFEVGETVRLLGAHFRFGNIYPELYKDWHARRTQAGIRMQATVPDGINVSDIFPSLELLETRRTDVPVSPNVVWVFGEYVANVLWLEKETTTIFLMKNKLVADQYREHFAYFWEHGTEIT